MYIAYKKFGQGAEEPEFTGFAKIGYNKFYVDEIYNAVFVQPYKGFGSVISRFLEPKVTDSWCQAFQLALPESWDRFQGPAGWLCPDLCNLYGYRAESYEPLPISIDQLGKV